MNYTGNRHVGSTGDVPECFMIPHNLIDFDSMGTREETAADGRQLLLFHGVLRNEQRMMCPRCWNEMYVNNTFATRLRHLPFGSALSFISFTRRQFLCPNCGKTKMENVSFRAEHHRITKELEVYAEELLQRGYTNKEVSEITGIGQSVIKEIDNNRLRREYTEGGEERKNRSNESTVVLKKPDSYARCLAIDEFKLHDGYKFATHIIDLETGHILWIGYGKRKQVVYDFIDHIGEEWMSHVEAVACDMNSDFQEAFEERCNWIQPVFDHFHIVKNFNDKVVAEVRKDEQKRLEASGDIQGARALKKTKYILTSKRSTLRRKDQEAADGKILSSESSLFHQPEVKRHGGYETKYDQLLKENSLLFTLDLVKEQLDSAYQETNETEMAHRIMDIIDMCNATDNKHLKWFARLLDHHFTGIISHASFRISTGKIEGINNKIKAIRRQAYGIPDDEYFFLKIIDASYRTYVRNPKSHMFSH